MRTNALHEVDSSSVGSLGSLPGQGVQRPRRDGRELSLRSTRCSKGSPRGGCPGRLPQGPAGQRCPLKGRPLSSLQRPPTSVGPGLSVGKEPRRWCLGLGCP